MRFIISAAFAAILIAATGPSPAAAEEEVDLELVLLADASGSIDDAEIRFQRLGYAAAITHPRVLAAITHGFTQRTSPLER